MRQLLRFYQQCGTLATAPVARTVGVHILPSLIVGNRAKEVKVSQAGNYPDCECCHYKMAYDEEAQSLDMGSGQKTPTNSAMVPCLDVGAIVNRVTWGPSEKIERLRELLARHQ